MFYIWHQSEIINLPSSPAVTPTVGIKLDGDCTSPGTGGFPELLRFPHHSTVRETMKLVILRTEWAFPNSPLCNGRKATLWKKRQDSTRSWTPRA